MSFIVNISDLDTFSYETGCGFMSPIRNLIAGIGRKGIKLFDDSLVIFSSIDKELLESIEKIDIGELEKEIEEGAGQRTIDRARQEITADILVQEDQKVKDKKSIEDCSNLLSTRTRISRLLNQSM